MVKYKKVIVEAPLRISLGGGGTDLPEFIKKHGKGHLILGAIDSTVSVSLEVNDSGLFNINFRDQVSECTGLEKITDPLIQNALRSFDWEANLGLDLKVESHVPHGTGLGFSGAMLVALVKGISELVGSEMSATEIAERGFAIEAGMCGRPVGKQDFYGAALGGILVMDLDSNNIVTVKRIMTQKREYEHFINHVALYYTGVQRNAGDILSKQSNLIKHNTTKKDCMKEILRIGYDSYDALINLDMVTYGKLLDEHWRIKRSIMQEMSTDQIDLLYAELKDLGAIGVKLIGAGGGGFLMVCASPDQLLQIDQAMERQGIEKVHYSFDMLGVRTICKS